MKKQNPALKRLWDYAVITVSCAVYALAFNCLFQPNDLVVGGFTGIAQILNHLFPILPVGTTVFVMNVPLMIVGVRKQGPRLLISTLFALAVSSAMIDGLDMVLHVPSMDPLLASIYGGLLMGASIGLMMLKGATTGGSDLLARMLKYKFRSLSIGRLCMIIDVIVTILYAIVFQNVNAALYGIIVMYISSISMDMVVYGSVNAKMAYIISGHSQEIARQLLEMELGVTMLDGHGAFTGDEKQVILCAFKRNQIANLKATVTAIDPNAFIIVCEAHEVLGEGFGAYTPDSL